MQGLFPGTSSPPGQSSKTERHKRSVTTCRLTNINVIPIDYAFRPRLRDRLTLRRLTLRRNPWTFGDSVFHTVCRYSCQHSHFCSLQEPSRVSLHGRQNAPLPRSGISDQQSGIGTAPPVRIEALQHARALDDTRLAIAHMCSDPRIPGPSNISAKPASHLLSQSPSEDSV